MGFGDGKEGNSAENNDIVSTLPSSHFLQVGHLEINCENRSPDATWSLATLLADYSCKWPKAGYRAGKSMESAKDQQ